MIFNFRRPSASGDDSITIVSGSGSASAITKINISLARDLW